MAVASLGGRHLRDTDFADKVYVISAAVIQVVYVRDFPGDRDQAMYKS
jgi:hypothetical protein